MTTPCGNDLCEVCGAAITHPDARDAERRADAAARAMEARPW